MELLGGSIARLALRYGKAFEKSRLFDNFTKFNFLFDMYRAMLIIPAMASKECNSEYLQSGWF